MSSIQITDTQLVEVTQSLIVTVEVTANDGLTEYSGDVNVVGTGFQDQVFWDQFMSDGQTVEIEVELSTAGAPEGEELTVTANLTDPSPGTDFTEVGPIGGVDEDDILIASCDVTNIDGSDDEWEPGDEGDFTVFIQNTDLNQAASMSVNFLANDSPISSFGAVQTDISQPVDAQVAPDSTEAATIPITVTEAGVHDLAAEVFDVEPA